MVPARISFSISPSKCCIPSAVPTRIASSSVLPSPSPFSTYSRVRNVDFKIEEGKRKATILASGVWAARTGESGPIHIHITGTEKFHTTVTNQPDSERYHRTLFRDLRRLLVEQHCWPYGNEGAETENRAESVTA